jgi:mannan polymerase II complex MNN11 subunit
MHFAFPPRKTSQPPPYARASRKPPGYRQQQLRLLGYFVCGLLTIYLFFQFAPFSSTLVESIPPGTPPVVIVTVFDEQYMSEDYIRKIKANREDYASRQGQQKALGNMARVRC